MPTYEFSCASGHSFVKRAGIEAREVDCQRCDGRAFRAQVNRVNSIGWARTPASERDLSRDFKNFQEAGAELEYSFERERDARQIENLKPPPLWEAAKAKANDLRKKGVTSASDL